MEQFFTKIFEFFSSPQFTAAMASILAAWTMIYPIINKVIKVKADGKLAKMTSQLATKTAEFAALQDQILAMAKTADKLTATVKDLKANAKGQNEALLTAFNSSNLKQDVKSYIGKILEVKETVEDIITPAKIETVTPTEEENKPKEENSVTEKLTEFVRVR